MTHQMEFSQFRLQEHSMFFVIIDKAWYHTIESGLRVVNQKNKNGNKYNQYKLLLYSGASSGLHYDNSMNSVVLRLNKGDRVSMANYGPLSTQIITD